MANIQPFIFDITQSDKDKLLQKLDDSVFPDELDEVGWEYGTPLADVKRLAAYWRKDFDWESMENKIKSLPNYTSTIEVEGFEPLDIHFLHMRSGNDDAIPLLFLHGWPGSFMEVERLLPFLINDDKMKGVTFHVVAPSLPNHVFSSGVSKRGFGLGQYAETCHKLMINLGYEQYASVGGDWGSSITRVMSQLYPQSLKACYLNLVPSTPPSPTRPWAFIPFIVRHILNMYTPAEQAGLARSQEFQKTGMGYFQEQNTKPQTIGYALSDSPVGLLAWMYEKMRDWTDEYPWTDEEVCTWVSLYWFSKAGPAASLRLYYESTRGKFPAQAGGYVPHVKLGLAYFPKEIFRLPKAWGSSLGNVVFEHEHDKGGHFAAWERPEAVAEDLKVMFGDGGGANGVVKLGNGKKT
ncbi:hypothetical protein HYFRA_00002042 [Hymenoscyphus fraxineus]|uniref:Epoxide hydrolase N-terminal domain-containing protein n=1 Tax=Hymenoscyphus fraxineus TaxID=746836 RepID=A0A9N9KMX5_9HELO|nr:hypothetical protein HYFRA_00002042 [Hymenoscyphus fraxineus]